VQDTVTGYEAPETLDGAVSVLRQHGGDAKVLAGGQSLLVLLQQGLLAPSVLVSLKRVLELRSISFSPSDGMQIGAMVTQAELERSDVVREHYAALGEAATVVASVQIRNQGTLGGNLCHADPTADPPAALIALGATLELIGPAGKRTLPVEDFFRYFLEVDLGDAEVLARVLLPAPAPRHGSAYLKHRLRHGDRAIAGVATWVRLAEDDSRIENVRIGLSGVGSTPLRPVHAEQLMQRHPPSEELLAACGDAAAAGCEPLDDTEASAWYRREMVRVLVPRALSISLRRAGSPAFR
jgi:aerobic carbon-monoxide dehydrogenase medium subunit